jgi:MFS family permease
MSGENDELTALTTAQPLPGTANAAEVGAAEVAESSVTDGPTRPVSKSFIVFMMLASFGASMALMVPLAYGLAVRISQLAPGHEEVLGYVTGTAQLTYLVFAPLIGIWSDRTRSRFGRRTPFLVIGALLGIVALVIVAVAPTVPLIIAGWILGMAAWSTAGGALQNWIADRVPEEQRGRVSALTGVTTQVAPIIGIGIAYAVSQSTLLVFLLPGLIGLALILLLPIVKREGSSKDLPVTNQVTVRKLVASYGFNARKYPDFAWNWLGRFLFFTGLYFNTTFGVFFYAQRLGMTPVEVGGVVAAMGLVGVVAAVVGALVGGFLSDKFKRRRLFTLIGSIVFVIGGITEAFAWSLPQIIVGAICMQLAIALFATVNQAIVLAVIPDRTETGRYMAIVSFAQKIPSAIAPLIAPLIITIGVVNAEDPRNYTALYLAGTVFAIVGGLIVQFKVKSVR